MSPVPPSRSPAHPDAALSSALGPLLAAPRLSAILLDIDGTLAPIVEHAADAHVTEQTRRLLIALARRYALVACVSGRQASEARAMVSIGSITYVGAHGAELLRAGWTEAQLNPRVEEWKGRIDAFRRSAGDAELRRRRIRIEDKSAMVAFHWRGAPDEQAARDHLGAVAERARVEGLSPHWGRKVLEVRAPVQADKGDGVRTLLDGTDIQHVLYAGDDVTDLDAFGVLDEMRTRGDLQNVLRVGVRSDDGPAAIVAQADVVVDGVAGVVRVLTALSEGVGSSEAVPDAAVPPGD